MQLALQLRNEGVAPEERYEDDDPNWTPPPDSVPGDVALEAALDFSETLGTDSEDEEEDEEEDEDKGE